MNVVGESFRNPDGTDRQEIIPRCVVGEWLILEHEPDNPHDINAIKVLRETGEQIGYLPRDFAGEIVSRGLDDYHAVVAGVGRSDASGLYGVALLMVIDKADATNERIHAYALRVLRQDRQIGDLRPAVRRTSASPARPPLDWTPLIYVVGGAVILVGGFVWAVIIMMERGAP